MDSRIRSWAVGAQVTNTRTHTLTGAKFLPADTSVAGAQPRALPQTSRRSQLWVTEFGERGFKERTGGTPCSELPAPAFPSRALPPRFYLGDGDPGCLTGRRRAPWISHCTSPLRGSHGPPSLPGSQKPGQLCRLIPARQVSPGGLNQGWPERVRMRRRSVT